MHISFHRNRWIFTFILCVGMLNHANAQTYTERVQKKVDGKGTVTIHQSEEIDQLVNDPSATGVPQQTQKPNDSKKLSEPVKDNRQQANAITTTSLNTNKENKEEVEQPVETTKKTTQKITGYRVQAFAGGNSRKDRQTAEQIRNNIKAQIPNVSVYVHFYSPRWICRVGNFRTYEEAHQMMVRLQNMGYKQASIVKGKITVSY
ncbi:MAG: SPOR domain-containing protein [Prevotella sp.]|nr:SPOR domain-containing protein [Prevotella sp.]MBQ8153590.1 SPOR domain-containing protein [Prevotella sp.]